MIQAVESAYTPTPTVIRMEEQFDVKAWITSLHVELHNIVSPQCFVMQKALSGDVVLRYKNWSTDREWLPSRNPDECIVILKVARMDVEPELTVLCIFLSFSPSNPPSSSSSPSSSFFFLFSFSSPFSLLLPPPPFLDST